MEESKYLGGDIDHTHLVKGLDYRLLQKTKMEQEMEEKKQKEEELSKEIEKQMEKAVPHVIIPTNKTGGLLFNNSDTEKQEKQVTFNTHIGRQVYNILFDKVLPKTTDQFTNGRTTFIFDLEDGDIPTTVIRSKDETSKFKVCDTVYCLTEQGITERHTGTIDNATNYWGIYRYQGWKKEKRKRARTS